MTMKVDVKGCSSCGQDHDDMVFQFGWPVVIGGFRYTHYARCPVTGDNVYMRTVVETKVDKPKGDQQDGP